MQWKELPVHILPFINATRDLIIEALAMLHEMKAEMTSMMRLIRKLQSGLERMKELHDLAEVPAHEPQGASESRKRKRDAKDEEQDEQSGLRHCSRSCSTTEFAGV